MLHDTFALWLAFIVVGLATTLPRSSFFIAPKKFQPSQRSYSLLKYAPISALTAIIVPDLVYVDQAIQLLNPKFFAALCTILTILITRNPWLPFIIGTSTLILIQSRI